MYPEVYSSGNLKAILNNINTNKLTKRVNNKYLFEFQCYQESLKTEYLVDGNQVYVDNNQIFDISYIRRRHAENGLLSFFIKCEHVYYRLAEDEFTNYTESGTVTEILTDILSGTDFSVGTVEFTDTVVFAENRKINKMEIVQDLANEVGGLLDFDGFEISILDLATRPDTYEIRVNKNLKGLDLIVDKRGIDYTSYTIDAVNIFKSDDFVNRGLENLEVLNVGDKVTVIDEDMSIDVEQSVLEIIKDVIKDKKLNVSLVNTILNLNDDIFFNKINAVKKDENIYGIEIGNDVGIIIERYDQLARTTMNAELFSMDKGDGIGGYTPALFFNVLDEEYEFTGNIKASSFEGGSIDIGTGTFTVNSSGDCVANSLEANGGDISGGTIDGTTITGVNIQADVFEAEDFVTINTNSSDEGLFLNAFVDMYFKVYDPGGTAEIGPSIRITNDLRVGDDLTVIGDATVGGSDVVTESTGIDLYCHNESSQNIGLQIVSGELEVFIGSTYQFTLTP